MRHKQLLPRAFAWMLCILALATAPMWAELVPYEGESSWPMVTIRKDPSAPTVYLSVSSEVSRNITLTIELLRGDTGASAGTKGVALLPYGMEAVDLRKVLPNSAYTNGIFRGRPRVFGSDNYYYTASLVSEVIDKGVRKYSLAAKPIARVDDAYRQCEYLSLPVPELQATVIQAGGLWGAFGPSERIVRVDLVSPSGLDSNGRAAASILGEVTASGNIVIAKQTALSGPGTIRVYPHKTVEGYFGVLFGTSGFSTTLAGAAEGLFCRPKCGSGDSCGAGSSCNPSSICYDSESCTSGCVRPTYTLISGSLDGTVGSPMDAIIEAEQGSTFSVLSLPPGVATAPAGSWRLRVYGTPTGAGQTSILVTKAFPANCSTSITGTVTGSSGNCSTNPPTINFGTPVTSLSATTLTVSSIPVTPTGGGFTPLLPQVYTRPTFGQPTATRTIVYNLPYSVNGLSCNVSKSIDVSVPPQGGACDNYPVPTITLGTPNTSSTATTFTVNSISASPSGGSWNPTLPQTYQRPAAGQSPQTKNFTYTLPYSPAAGLSCTTNKSVDVSVPPQAQTCEQQHPPTGDVTVGGLSSSTLTAHADIFSTGDYDLYIYAWDNYSSCTGGSNPQYEKRHVEKTLLCNQSGVLDTSYPWGGHGANGWKVVLKRNGVVIDQSSCINNTQNNSVAPSELEWD